MVIRLHLLAWISVSMLLLAARSVSAQCSPPGTFWLNSPQTSNALTFNWTPVSGATKYQIRYWETIAPGDKTLINDFVTPPFVLTGLKKSTTYTVQVRSICGNATSSWGTQMKFFDRQSY